MKSTGSTPKTLQPPKPQFRRTETTDRRFPTLKGNTNRWRIVQSVHAGHVRGGHGFH
jgi:hypothetical protein